MRRIPTLVLLLVLNASTVSAQGNVCLDQNSHQLDPAATQTWAGMVQRSDRQLMGQLAGTWYIETRSPYTAQFSQEYQQLSPDGFLTYQERICNGETGICNDYSGQGSYAVIGLPDGTMNFMIMVSDLSRDHQCNGSVARFAGANTLQLDNGGVMQRVQ